jgi:hypothetical protein
MLVLFDLLAGYALAAGFNIIFKAIYSLTYGFSGKFFAYSLRATEKISATQTGLPKISL